MPDYRRALLKGGTFFFTVVTYARYPIFRDEAAIDLLDRCFDAVAAKLPYNMDAIVILPDHLHCIWTLPDDDTDFSARWKRIKATFTGEYSGPKAASISASMRKKKEAGVWQRRFWEHQVRDQMDFNRHCDYIHYNPVRHGCAQLPTEWKHSSFGQFVDRGLYPHDWGHTEPGQVKGMECE